MRFSLLPKETKFFDYFDEMAGYLVEESRTFEQMLTDFTALPQKERMLKEIEHEGDVAVQMIVKGVNRAFVTPWDREDIHSMATTMDNVLDAIEALGHRFVAYGVKKPTEKSVELAGCLVRSCEELQTAIKLSRDWRDLDAVHAALAEVDRMEHEADALSRQAIHELFTKNQHDILQLIVWKELYERLEGASDRCRDVADLLMEISIKYA